MKYPCNRSCFDFAPLRSVRTGFCIDLLVAYPQRFLAALDLGGDRMHRIQEWDLNLRTFLRQLPRDTQHQIAYRSAWKLLFGEEFA